MILRVIICFLILCSAAYADEVTYYFDTIIEGVGTNPENLIDGSILTYAELNYPGDDYFLLQGTTWVGTPLGEITAVSIRTYCEPLGLISYVFFMDRIAGSYLDEAEGTCGEEGSPDWTEYYKIRPAQSHTWALSDMDTLIMLIYPNGYTSKFYKVELKVTYTPPNIRGVNIN